MRIARKETRSLALSLSLSFVSCSPASSQFVARKWKWSNETQASKRAREPKTQDETAISGAEMIADEEQRRVSVCGSGCESRLGLGLTLGSGAGAGESMSDELGQAPSLAPNDNDEEQTEQELRLRRLVESAESKLSRCRLRTPAAKEEEVGVASAGSRQNLGPAGLNSKSNSSSRAGGPTPTNDLVRHLRDRDRAALFASNGQEQSSNFNIQSNAINIKNPEIRVREEHETRPSVHGLALRALRSVSPRRATVAGEVNLKAGKLLLGVGGGGDGGGSSASTEPMAQQRRHSAYLFPAYLLAAGAAVGGPEGEGESSDDDDFSLLDQSSHTEDEPEESNELELGQEARRMLNKTLEVVVQRQLRNSASSPSALNTPTNLSANASAGSCSCCERAKGGEQSREATTSGATNQTRFLPSTTARQWQASGHLNRQKRHSLMDALQAGGHRLYHSVARHHHHHHHQEQADSNQQPIERQEHYDPLIPETGFKIVVMGTSGSGKSSIIQRFLYDSFNWRHQPTVEDTYFVEFPYLKQMINISISDTSGTYQFPAMRRLAINSSDAFILVYSVDNPKSFDYVEELRQNILDERERAYSEQASASTNTTSSTSQSNSSSSSVAALNSTASGRLLGGPITQQHHHHQGRHWSLASIFSHQQQNQHRSHAPSLGSTSGACSSLSSSVCSSSDSSRRSSVSAAEAALKTRRTRRPPMVIVANKYDLAPEEHLVNSDEIEALTVIDWNNGFVRASAALNLNIDDIFQQVLRQAKQPPTLTEAIVSKRRKSLPPRLPNQQQQHN